MDDVRGDFLRPPHGTTPAAVIANKILRFDPLEAIKNIQREIVWTILRNIVGTFGEAVLTYTHNLCSEQNYKKI